MAISCRQKIFGVSVVVVAIAAAALIGLRSKALTPALRESIRLCLPKFVSSSLPVLAETQGYFREQGLDVALDIEILGKICVTKLIAKETDLAVAYVTPVVRALIDQAPLHVLSELHSANHNTSIVYPNAGRVQRQGTLRGARIGYVPGTNAEYLLRLFLLAHELEFSDIISVDLTQDEIQTRLESGAIDAGVIWEPYLSRILRSRADDHTMESSFYTELSILLAIGDNGGDARVLSVLRALKSAQDFLEQNPEAARQIVTQRLHLAADDSTPEIFHKFRMKLGLSSMLRTVMGQEADMMSQPTQLSVLARRHLVDSAIQKQYLHEVAPEAVTLE